MNGLFEDTLQRFQRVQGQRTSLQAIMQYHMNPSPDKRIQPTLLGGNDRMVLYRQVLLRHGCEESVLRQRLQNKPSPNSRSRTPPHRWRLQLLNAQGDCPDFPLARQCTIGRGDTCDLLLPLPEISRKHVVLMPWEEKISLVDFHSKNGTQINGQPVTHGALKNGDILMLADVAFRVQRTRNWPLWWPLTARDYLIA
jgi:hypothetical protein